MVGISRHYCSTVAKSLIVVPMLNCGTSAPLLAIYCWQQLNFLIMFYVTFRHPKNGLQHTDRPTKEQMAKWLSYMIAFHSITDVNVYEGGRYNKEKLEYEGGKRINLTIPKWS